MIEIISKRMGTYLSQKISATPKENAAIVYGLQIILGAVLKGIFLLLTAYLLGILFPMLVVMGTASYLRILSGGAHFSTYYRCLCAGLLVFNGLGYLTVVLTEMYNHLYMIPILMLVTLTGMIVAYKYAPADAVKKPNKDNKKKNLLKDLSIAFIIVWYSTIMLLVNPLAVNFYWKAIVIASSLGIIWQSLTITPLGFKLYGAIDNFLDKFTLRRWS
jgi:accessory gene regulator B